MNYYGAFYRSALYSLLTRINAYLMRWVRNKYDGCEDARRRRRPGGRHHELLGSSPTGPGSTAVPAAGDQDDKSRVTGDCYARICGSRRVRLPPATRQAVWMVLATR